MKTHVILVAKYRKKYFCNTERNDRIKQYAYESSQKHGFEILVMETDKDHMHLLIQYNVKDSVADIVKALKQYTTHKMWECDRTGLKQLYWKHKCLWSDGYFACSIGEASEKTIKQYIANQG